MNKNRVIAAGGEMKRLQPRVLISRLAVLPPISLPGNKNMEMSATILQL